MAAISDSCFRSDFAFAFHRIHNPCSLTGGFSMEGTPFLLQRRPLQLRGGRGPWSTGTHHTDDTFRPRADDTALWSTLLVSAFGRIGSPPAGRRHMDHSAAELPKPHPSNLFAPRSASMLHPASLALHYLHISASCQDKSQDRPSTCTFIGASGLRKMHDAPRTSILESILRGTSDGNFAC